MRCDGRRFALLIGIFSAPLAAQEPVLSGTERLDTAAEARAAGDFDRARQILLPMLAEKPNDPDLLRRLAMVEAGARQLNLALDRIDKARRLAQSFAQRTTS